MTTATSPLVPSGFVWLDAVPTREVQWLWQGFIPRGVLTLVEGPPGAGKSSILRELVACVTVGRPMAGEAANGPAREPSRVLWLSSEEDVGVQLRPVIDATRGDAARVLVLGDDGWRPSMLASVETMIADHNIALVVADQLKDHLDALGDESETAVRSALRPWVRLAQRTGAAVCGVRHWRKSIGSAADRGAGSVGYLALARQTIVVAKHDVGRVIAVGKAYRSAPASHAFEIDADGRVDWRGETTVTADDLASWQPASTNGAPRPRPARDEAVERLRHELANGPRAASAVRTAMEVAGFSTSTIDRARRTLGVASTGRGKATTWALPNDTTTDGV